MLHTKAVKDLKILFETDLSLSEFTRESLKIPEVGNNYQKRLQDRIKAIRNKKIELLHM